MALLESEYGPDWSADIKLMMHGLTLKLDFYVKSESVEIP